MRNSTKSRIWKKQRQDKEQEKGISRRGDRNTKYFHAVASQRRRKTTIFSLDGPDGAVETNEEMLDAASEYYKNLFKFEPRPEMNISNEFFSREEKFSKEESESLESKFTEIEIKKSMFESYPDGAHGPDGITFRFYQKFWEVIKEDLLDMFSGFYHDKLDLYRLNFALITIIPKENDARVMSKFRPISLLNCSYKVFTKVLTNRIGVVADRIVASNQTTFIKGRYILESVVTAHEILHDMHHNK
jgi:hypothetical protein